MICKDKVYPRHINAFQIVIPRQTAERFCRHPRARNIYHGFVMEWACPDCGAWWDKDYE